MGRIKRSNTLSRIFMRYVLVMLGALVTLVVVTYLILLILINTECIYPANYAEQKINEAYDTILNADEVTEDMIPPLCHYVLFSMDGKIIGTDMSEQYHQIAWEVANHGNASGKYFYKVIPRPKEYVVLQYRLTPQYHSAFLREHFMGPQSLMTMVFVFGGMALIILPSISFGRRMRKKMQPMLGAIEQIKNQNLEYEYSYSGIKEIDDCLSVLDDMREALKVSLKQQWRAEQDKNRQMSALAHDIKTPLTIVRGNAELLLETELTKVQENYIGYVINGTTQIQNYVQKLIDVTKSLDKSFEDAYETIMTKDFLEDIKKQASGLSKIYHLKMKWKEQWE